jgi:hypothetical protein
MGSWCVPVHLYLDWIKCLFFSLKEFSPYLDQQLFAPVSMLRSVDILISTWPSFKVTRVRKKYHLRSEAHSTNLQRDENIQRRQVSEQLVAWNNNGAKRQFWSKATHWKKANREIMHHSTCAWGYNFTAELLSVQLNACFYSQQIHWFVRTITPKKPPPYRSHEGRVSLVLFEIVILLLVFTWFRFQESCSSYRHPKIPPAYDSQTIKTVKGVTKKFLRRDVFIVIQVIEKHTQEKVAVWGIFQNSGSIEILHNLLDISRGIAN